MGVFDLFDELDDDELQELIDDIFTAQVSESFEAAIREEIEAADPTLREDAVEQNELFQDLELALGLEPSEPPTGPLPGQPAPAEDEPAIRERTQAEREARRRLINLIQANAEDVEALLDIAAALDQREAGISGLFTQERIETLSEMDLDELADRAREAVREAEPPTLDDLPALARAVRRGAGRDVAYFERVIAELRGDRSVQTLERQGVDAEQLAELRDDFPSVVEAAVDEAETAIEGLERGVAPGPAEPAEPPTQPISGRPSPFGANADKQLARQFFSGDLMRAQAWVAAEQERLSRHAELDPTEFWEEVGADIWSPTLTRAAFVDPSAVA